MLPVRPRPVFERLVRPWNKREKAALRVEVRECPRENPGASVIQSGECHEDVIMSNWLTIEAM